MKRLHRHLSARAAQRGLTLVELMVGLVISIVVSLAAAALYLSTRESTRAAQSLTDVNETAKIAFDMLGREIQKAGFFPAQFTTPTDVSKAGRYYNAKAGTPALFDAGLHGCDGAGYLAGPTHACDATVANTPDTLIVNYFTSPEFGAGSLFGNGNDCNRQPAANEPDNAGAGPTVPMFVSNRFSIVDSNYTGGDGQTIATRALACHGNGDDANAAPQPAVHGIWDMVIRYGVGTGTDALQSPTRFLTATQVNAVGNDPDGRRPWERVTAVSVCLVVRSIDHARLDDKSSTPRTYRNCRGVVVSLPSTDRYIYASFERVFAVRNNLNSVGL